MGSRIMPAMADGRQFTNYVSSGLYNNALEAKFKTPDDSEYRAYLQKNAASVKKTIGQLTAFYVKPPVMPKTKLNVQGETNAHMVSAPVNYDQKILDKGYYKGIAKFNTSANQQKQYLMNLDNQNVKFH